MSGQKGSTSNSNLSGVSMLELYRMEAETHTAVLSNGLVSLASGAAGTGLFEGLMRSAHSLKGAARIVGLQQAVTVAHAMEDCFVEAQHGRLALHAELIDVLLKGTDFLVRSGSEEPYPDAAKDAAALVSALKAARTGARPPAAAPPSAAALAPVAETAVPPATAPVSPGAAPMPESPAPPPTPPTPAERSSDPARAVRVNAASLSRLMGLAGESLVEAAWLERFERSLRQLLNQHARLTESFEALQNHTPAGREQDAASAGLLRDIQQKNNEFQQSLAEQIHAFETYSLRSENLSQGLYREAIESRMRPFGDGVQGFPRMVHDLARTLGKNVRLEIAGKEVDVDRDILERLEAPLNHLLRNALDHGLEPPAERAAAGKKEQCRIVLEAMHKGGMLFVAVSDDGRGVDVERVRKKIVERRLATEAMAAVMTEAEVLEFLFLPGFTTASKVTEVSGRGVGLDVVRAMIQDVSGQIRVTTKPGVGATFNLQLPITLSVLRVLLVEIAGDPFAFPLARIDHVLKIQSSQIQSLTNRQYFQLDGANIGLAPARQVLDLGDESAPGAEIPVVIIGARAERYGLAVDRVLGERQVVVRPLDPRLGKVTNISAASLTEDGRPLLIVDVDDMVRSIERLLTGGRRLTKVLTNVAARVEYRKRVLVVDDSLTVREVERKLLVNRGYDVEVATDGADGWNALRSGRFDLIISDVDMPRMNGIELVGRIRADGRYKDLPVMIVSYKDREEDRLKGLEAGANYYLTKSSFHDETLLAAVLELIGEPQ